MCLVSEDKFLRYEKIPIREAMAPGLRSSLDPRLICDFLIVQVSAVDEMELNSSLYLREVLSNVACS